MKNSYLLQSATFKYLLYNLRHLYANVSKSLPVLGLIVESFFVLPIQIIGLLAFDDCRIVDISKVSGRTTECVKQVFPFVWPKIDGEKAVLSEKRIAFDFRIRCHKFPHPLQFVFPFLTLFISISCTFHYFRRGTPFPAFSFPQGRNNRGYVVNVFPRVIYVVGINPLARTYLPAFPYSRFREGIIISRLPSNDHDSVRNFPVDGKGKRSFVTEEFIMLDERRFLMILISRITDKKHCPASPAVIFFFPA